MARSKAATKASNVERDVIAELDRKVHWLSAWTIHHANHLRESRDGLKVGSHQASSASIATRHSISPCCARKTAWPSNRTPARCSTPSEYLVGRQSVDPLQRFRAFGGAP